MPATRSSSQQPRKGPFPNSTRPHSQASRNRTKSGESDSFAHEVISLSSEGESSSVVGAARLKRIASSNKKQPSAKCRSKGKISLPEDIIEISSDDESDPPVAVVLAPIRGRLVGKDTGTPPAQDPAAIANFRRQVIKYRDEIAKTKISIEKASKELSNLREENKELKVDIDQISTLLNCSICMERMWEPYVLPNCGHMFCQSCLIDWLAQQQAQYVVAHPHYNPNAITHPALNDLYRVVQSIMINPCVANHPQIKALLDQSMPQHPKYTCPTCREHITSRPTELFVMKEMVRIVVASSGEISPKKAIGVRHEAPENAWDGYFPNL